METHTQIRCRDCAQASTAHPGNLSWNVMALGLMDNLKRNIDPTTGSLLG
jgi:hypothetical protein